MSKEKKSPLCFAAIDIGSNAVRLLIKSVDENAMNRFSKLMMLRYPLRLGFDVFTKGKISRKKEAKMLQLMKAYRQLLKVYDVDAYRACATSAMRDARNGQKIMEKIKEEAGIDIEIINGQEEASIIYNNHLEYMEDRRGNYMYVDVGGGSTEVNFLTNGKLVMSKSYNIGTVRMLNEAVDNLQWEQMEKDIYQLGKSHQDIQIIGSGGNINKYYRLAETKDKEHLSMPVEELQRLYNQLKGLDIDDRMNRFDLKPDRADVIVPAGEIFLRIAQWSRARDIFVPVIGLADGIIDGLYAQSRMNRSRL